MEFSQFFESTFFVCMMASVLIGLPMFLTYERFFGVARTSLGLALMGFYTVLFLVKPAVAPIWSIWIAVFGFVAWLRYLRKGHREPLWDPLRFWPAVLILVYGFSLFLFRWEPPGDVPVLQGVWGNEIFVGNSIPAQLPEVSPFQARQMGGVGFPAIAALIHMGGWAPLERILSFMNSLGLVIFIFSLGSALTTWFSRWVSYLTAATAMILFALPAQFLAWGGGAQLLGLCGGFCLLEFCKTAQIRDMSWFELVLYGLSMAFCAYCDGASFVVSSVLMLPVILWVVRLGETRIYKDLGKLLLVFFMLIFPDGSFWDSLAVGGISLSELNGAIAPALYYTQKPLMQAAWIQLTLYLGMVPILLSTLLALLSMVVGRMPIYAGVWGGCVCVCLGMFLNSHVGILPFSHLFRPHLVAASMLLPFSLPFGWMAHFFLQKRDGVSQWALWGSCVGIVLLMGFQFSQTLLPFLFQSKMTANDRRAMVYLARYLPPGDCVGILDNSVGKWIPVVASRCVRPQPTLQWSDTQWFFVADGEPTQLPENHEVVYSRGAIVIRRINPES